MGSLLAEMLAWSFFDADAFHPPENVDQMRAGEALSEEAREPWLDALAALITGLLVKRQNAVLACSALRSAYRERLRRAADDTPGEVRFVFLDISLEEAERRLQKRKGHFMPPSLVESQLETLEPPHAGLRLAATLPPAELVHEIRLAWGL